VIAALTDAGARYPRWGFWKLFHRRRVEGRLWNHKHVHRVYCALRLNLPRRTTRRVPRRIRQSLAAPPVLNQTWALDFMTETLYDGRRVRLLTVIDEGNREGLEIAMGLSLPRRRVIRVLDELVAVHGRPSTVRVDNGPEFTAQSFVDWCTEHGVAIYYIQPGKPDQNAYIERFNRSYRTERSSTRTCLNPSPSCRRSRPPGCGSTTASGLTTASAGCRRSHFCRGLHQRSSLP
jgi:putative transposase